jgi:hypothetical protein
VFAAELPSWVEGNAIGSASHEEIDALGLAARGTQPAPKAA